MQDKNEVMRLLDLMLSQGTRRRRSREGWISMRERSSGRSIGRDRSQRCWDRSGFLMICQGRLMIYRNQRMSQSTRGQYHLEQAQERSKGTFQLRKSLHGTRSSKWMKSASSQNSNFTSSKISSNQNLQRVNLRSTKRRSSSSKRYMPKSWDHYVFNTSNPNSLRRTMAYMGRQAKRHQTVACTDLQSSQISMMQLSNRTKESWSSQTSTSSSRETTTTR